MESPQERPTEKQYAADFEVRPKQLTKIISDAEAFLKQVGEQETNPELMPEAIFKAIKRQKERKAAAEAELKSIQEANAEKLTAHFTKKNPGTMQ